MHKYGKIVNLPEKTDPKKTYSWRYLSNFVDRMNELHVDSKHMSVVLEAILIHAKERNLLSRGFAVLSKVDIIQLVVKKLEKDCQSEHNKVENIKRNHEFLLKQMNGYSLFDILASRRRLNSYTNMTCWYEQGSISLDYIIASRTCRKVIGMLKQSEQSRYPNVMSLMKMRYKLLANERVVRELIQILGDDLFTD
jgi:hypothetical protein